MARAHDVAVGVEELDAIVERADPDVPVRHRRDHGAGRDVDLPHVVGSISAAVAEPEPVTIEHNALQVQELVLKRQLGQLRPGTVEMYKTYVVGQVVVRPRRAVRDPQPARAVRVDAGDRRLTAERVDDRQLELARELARDIRRARLRARPEPERE